MTAMITTRIREHIQQTFLFDDPSSLPPDDESLLENGIVDSTGVLDLILLVEEEFGVCVPDEDVIPANFDSIDRITRYIECRINTGRV